MNVCSPLFVHLFKTIRRCLILFEYVGREVKDKKKNLFYQEVYTPTVGEGAFQSGDRINFSPALHP